MNSARAIRIARDVKALGLISHGNTMNEKRGYVRALRANGYGNNDVTLKP